MHQTNLGMAAWGPRSMALRVTTLSLGLLFAMSNATITASAIAKVAIEEDGAPVTRSSDLARTTIARSTNAKRQVGPRALEPSDGSGIELAGPQFVTCCFGDVCIDGASPNPVTSAQCAAQGGFELVGVFDCAGDPCAGGACCAGPGACADVPPPNGAAQCAGLGGIYVGGANCTILATEGCPLCGLDDLELGGPDCQASNGGWLLISDRNFDPPSVRADDFTALAGGPLTEVCFEAAFFVPGGACCAGLGSQLPNQWSITVYEDDGIIPGAVVGPAGGQILQNVISGTAGGCTQTKSGSGLTGIVLTPGECYWMEISGFGEGLVGNPPAPGCATGVLSSRDGNNYMVRGLSGAYTASDIVTDIAGDPEADFAFCVEGGMTLCDRNAACCFDPGGPPPVCQDLSSVDCLLAGGVFTPGQACGPGVCPAPCEAETCADQVSLNAPGEACEFGLPCDRQYTNLFCNDTFQPNDCGNQGADTWYSYTTGPDECGDLTISTCSGDFDGFLSVYGAGPNCECPIDESQPLACDDDFCGAGGMSQVTFAASASTCYLIRAGGWQATTGIATLQLSIAATPGGCETVSPATVLADDAMNIGGNSIACANDGDCGSSNGGAATSVCRNGTCYARKGRFVSVSPNPVNTGLITARRVCVDAPGPGAHCHWVDAPGPPITHLGPGPQPILTANLLPVATGTAVYRDWSGDPVDSHGNIVVHIGGCAVSNGHDYYIQAIPQGADEANEASYSPALILPTQDTFGDVNGDGVSGIHGVFMVIQGFQNVQTLPRTWLKILPSGNAPANPGLITMQDALAQVRAFQGQLYEDQPGGGPPSSCP